MNFVFMDLQLIMRNEINTAGFTFNYESTLLFPIIVEIALDSIGYARTIQVVIRLEILSYKEKSDCNYEINGS
jgi:hypothetical protein